MRGTPGGHVLGQGDGVAIHAFVADAGGAGYDRGKGRYFFAWQARKGELMPNSFDFFPRLNVC